MDHGTARQLLSDGRLTAALEQHLRECGDCRVWADALDAVLHHAPSLVPPAPSDLHDRLIHHIAPAAAVGPSSGTGAAARRETGTVPPPPFRRPGWLLPVAAALTTAAAVVALAVWNGPAPSEQEPRRVLAAAVGRVHGVGATSFRFEVAGQSEVRLPRITLDGEIVFNGAVELDPTVPGPVPDVPPAPEPLLPERPQAPEAPEAPERPDASDGGFSLPGLDLEWPNLSVPRPPPIDVPTVELPELVALRDLTFERLCIQVPVACTPQPAEGTPPSAYADGLARLLPDLPATERAVLVDRLHLQLELERLGVDLHERIGVHEQIGVDGLELRFAGSGQSDGERGSTYHLDWRTVQPVETSGSLDVVTQDDQVWIRTTGLDRWLRAAAAPGFRLGPVTAPHDLDDVLDQLASPQVTPEDLGTDVLRGIQVRGLVVVDGDRRTEVWIGVDDGLVHRVRTERRASGQGTQVLAITVFDLYDHGTPVVVTAPTDATPIEDVPLLDLPAFWLDPTSLPLG